MRGSRPTHGRRRLPYGSQGPTEWLKVPRKLWLRERNSESDMVFAVVGEETGGDGGSYQLQWSLASAPRAANPNLLRGIVGFIDDACSPMPRAP